MCQVRVILSNFTVGQDDRLQVRRSGVLDVAAGWSAQ